MHQATLYLNHITTALQALLDALDAAILPLASCNKWAHRLIEIYEGMLILIRIILPC